MGAAGLAARGGVTPHAAVGEQLEEAVVLGGGRGGVGAAAVVQVLPLGIDGRVAREGSARVLDEHAREPRHLGLDRWHHPCPARRRTSACRKHVTRWSLTIPTACMNA